MEDGGLKMEDGGWRMEDRWRIADALVTKAARYQSSIFLPTLHPQSSILHPPSSIFDPPSSTPFDGRFWESNSNTRTPDILRITDTG